jgi:hypothetical protein
MPAVIADVTAPPQWSEGSTLRLTELIKTMPLE